MAQFHYKFYKAEDINSNCSSNVAEHNMVIKQPIEPNATHNSYIKRYERFCELMDMNIPLAAISDELGIPEIDLKTSYAYIGKYNHDKSMRLNFR